MIEMENSEKSYYVGVDPGQKIDPTFLVLLERGKDNVLRLKARKDFRLNTPYPVIIEHLLLWQRKFNIRRIIIDQTGVGAAIPDIAMQQGLHNVEGVVLTQQFKIQAMNLVKTKMQQGLLKFEWDRQLINELSAETMTYLPSGKPTFSHRTGTHDDFVWALVLAVYGARNLPRKYAPVAMVGLNHLAKLSMMMSRMPIRELASTYPGLRPPYDPQTNR
jgi:phage FluMu gp28-like protein